MAIKIISAIIAAFLMFVFLAAPVVKLKEIDLGIVILVGFAMMALDLWQSLKSREE